MIARRPPVAKLSVELRFGGYENLHPKARDLAEVSRLTCQDAHWLLIELGEELAYAAAKVVTSHNVTVAQVSDLLRPGAR